MGTIEQPKMSDNIDNRNTHDAEDIKLLQQILLDPFFHTLKGFTMFVEKQKQFSLDKEETQERFLFCIKHALNTFPNCFEFNQRCVERMIKHHLQANKVYPWNIDDLSRSIYVNKTFQPMNYNAAPNRHITAFMFNQKDAQQQLMQMKFAQHELQEKKIQLVKRLEDAQAKKERNHPLKSRVKRRTSTSTSTHNTHNTRTRKTRSKSVGRAH